MKENCNVILVDHPEMKFDKITKKIFSNSKGKLVYTDSMLSHSSPKFLYVCTSGENIRVGDYFISDSRNNVNEDPIYNLEQCIAINNDWIYGTHNEMNLGHHPNWSFKIIATNKIILIPNVFWHSTNVNENILYPKIPLLFIEDYIKKYNINQKIEKISVEYYENKLKITNNNEIIINKFEKRFFKILNY